MGLFGKKKTLVPEIPTNISPKNTLPSITHIPLPTAAPIPPTPPKTPTPQTSTPPVPTPEPHPAITVSTPTMSQEKMPTITTELNVKPETRTAGQNQPFFVRIDKFNETKENFEKVNQKIQEMEKVLQSLEMTQNEEKREIEAWKEDVTEMKSYLTQIDKEIFNKI